MQRVSATFLILLSLLGTTTCARDRIGPVVLVPAGLTAVAGNGQVGTAGAALAQPLVVLVTTSDGVGVSGVSVNWHVTAGGGRLSTTQDTTDAQGHATDIFTLGASAGTNVDTVQASVTGLAGSPVVYAASVAPGPASQLGLAAGNGQHAVVGQPLSDSLVVLALDQFGNPVTGATVSWSVAAGGGTLSPATPTDAQGRSAVAWTLGGGAGTQQVTATIPGAAGATQTFVATAAPGAPAVLLFTQPPSAAAAGVPITPAVQVSVADVFGNLVPSAALSIDIALGANPGGAVLSGQTSRTAVSGVATFSDLSLDKAASGYTLVAGAASLPTVTSAAFAVTLAGGPRLVFTTAPVTATAGAPLSPAVVVTAQDSLGGTIASFAGVVTIGIAANPANGTLSGTTTAAAVNGVATFTNLIIDKSGVGYTLTAAAAGAATGVSPPFLITSGPASQLVFSVQPANTPAASPIVPPLVVLARDAFGNTATTFTGSVTIAIGTNPGGGTLSGTTTISAVAGVATFSNLVIDKNGNGYTLVATASALTSATSAPFQVIIGSQVIHFVFTGQPGNATAGAPIAPPVSVAAFDPLGNPATSYAGAVTVALGANLAGGTLSGTTTVNAASGIATFNNLHVDKSGTGYTLTAAASGVTGATSTSFAITAAAAARIVVTAGDQQTAPAGTGLPVAYGARVVDAFGNHVAGATVNWAVTAGGGSLTPAQGSTDTSGLATATRTLGGHAGAQTARATVSGLADSAASFVATATPNGTISGTITLAAGSLAPPALRLWSSPRQMRRAVGTASPQYTPDELIVTYRSDALAVPPVGSPALAAPATITAMGATIRTRLASAPEAARYVVRGVSPTVLAARVRVLDSTDLDQVAAALRQDPAVATVERNGIVHLDRHQASAALRAATLPSEPLYPWQAWHYGLLDLPRAWAITTGSASVLVAVVDNGIRYDHPAVAANLTHDGYDFVSDINESVCAGGHISNAGDGDGYDPDPTIPADYDFDEKNNCLKGLTTSGDHGLHVSGTIGAVGNDGVGVTGVNWTVRIRPVRVLGVSGSGSFYDIAQGILYAAGLPADDGNGGTVQAPSAARVINLSLGGPSGSSTLHDAVIAATNAGALVVAAAGNDGTSNPLYPAAYPEALSVSAVGPDGILASYSTFGSTIDIAAPGGDIAGGGASFGVTSSVWNFVSNTAAYDSWDGTSMATPHVTGVAALLLAQTPSLTVTQLRSRLTTWAVDAGAAGPDNQYGAGIVNARNSLTQSFAPPAKLFARLYDATTGQLAATTATAGNGAYSFTALGDGSYWVFGGADENADGLIAVPGRAWGTLGGAATPTLVTVNGAGTYATSFSIAQPIEHEPNDVIAQANVLTVPGTVNGSLATVTDVDVVRVRIPQTGTYTFETSAQNGACGFALEANTVLTLDDSTGTVVATNDDIDNPALNYCSRITTALAAGTYYVAVSGVTAGRYRLAARPGI